MGKIIDISNNNNITDYERLILENDGVILKATEGTTYIDGTVDDRYNKLIGRIPIGFYHFARSTSEPETQAENFWNVIKDKNFTIKPVLDIEDIDIIDANDFIKRFKAKFNKLSNGIPLMLYSYTNYFETKISGKIYETFEIWEANYSGQPKFNPTLHQYTESGKTSYTSDNTDFSNILSENYLIANTVFEIKNTDRDNIVTQEIKRLQRELNSQGFGNLLIDGIVGQATRNALPLIKKGARGEITKFIQLRVGASPDGIFGNDTELSVKYFQRMNGLCDDGIVGKNTWYILLKTFTKGGVNWVE